LVITDRITQRSYDVCSSIVALAWVRLEQVSNDGFKGLWDIRIQSKGSTREWVDDAPCSRLFSRSVSAEDLEEHEPDCIEVRPGPELEIAACSLLWCHPDRCSAYALLMQSELGHCTSDAEVSHPCVWPMILGTVKEHVGWLQVLMEESS